MKKGLEAQSLAVIYQSISHFCLHQVFTWTPIFNSCALHIHCVIAGQMTG